MEIISTKHEIDNKGNIQRMYKLLKQQEQVEKNNMEWWQKFKLIK